MPNTISLSGFLSRFGIDLFLIEASFAVSCGLAWAASGGISVPAAMATAIVLGVAGGAALLLSRLHMRSRRYASVPDMVLIGQVSLAMSAVMGIAQLVFPLTHTRLDFLSSIIFGLFTWAFLLSLRGCTRLWAAKKRPTSFDQETQKRRALVIGAGDAGELVIRDLLQSKRDDVEIVGILDDSIQKQGLSIHGITVIGKTDEVREIADREDVQQALIAIPTASGSTMRRIVAACKEAKLSVLTLPSVTSVILGRERFATQLREVDIEDLLRREAVRTDLGQVCRYLRNEVVLVTGAGGSIGSELARQIAVVDPKKMILLGKGENSIFEIEQELNVKYGFKAVAVIADIRDEQAMQRVFAEHQPGIVFHAAAHKHVPLMQSNPIEAIRNNVMASWQLAKMSHRNGVKRFTLISTDKAVNPTSIMGATKRVAELLVASVSEGSSTKFSTVRFGNVLNSRGSLIPVLRKQIEAGGPVRITDAAMTRYFMTIPEASQLVLQAADLDCEAHAYLLDMGDPVKIVDLASDLIRLFGLVPDKDIDIIFTGPRPGEKLYEELMHSGDELLETSHPKISAVQSRTHVDNKELLDEVARLVTLCDIGDEAGAQKLLMDIAHGRTSAFALA